jgi:hypothetical protein
LLVFGAFSKTPGGGGGNILFNRICSGEWHMNIVDFMDAHFWALWLLVVWVAACIANWGPKK